jgi:hypothetical protein
MASSKVPRRRVAELAAILDSPEIGRLIEDLENVRWTGRPGYPIRSLLGVALAKSMYAIPTWSRTIALVHEHEGLQRALGDCPSVYAAYRFSVKLRRHGGLLEACIARVLARLRAERPGMGENIAIDASDLPAYANGQRFVSKGGRERALSEYSDPDASWGHRSAVSTRKGGGFYGYKVHMAVCTTTGLPLAWTVETARVNERHPVEPLLDSLSACGIASETCAMDKGYDIKDIYNLCESRHIRPIIPLKNTDGVKWGWDKPPSCEHGQWHFYGADLGRKATEWRCPTGECEKKLRWVCCDRLRPLVPRSTDRWKKLYRGRGAVEREFGRLKHEWAMLPLRVRGLAKVKLHVDLTILAKLTTCCV